MAKKMKYQPDFKNIYKLVCFKKNCWSEEIRNKPYRNWWLAGAIHNDDDKDHEDTDEDDKHHSKNYNDKNGHEDEESTCFLKRNTN